MGKQAVILSGGFGTRLSHVVSNVPKPMAPIKDKPFLEYIIEQLQKQGFDSFIFLTGYKSEIIENSFTHLPNTRFVKEETALGTGGAILNAFDFLNDDFYVINGDTFFDIDFSILEEFGKEYMKDCKVSVCPVKIAGGIQNKILEAMSMGIPVVTTPEGAEGIGASEDILGIANTDEEYAQKVISLIQNEQTCSNTTQNARKFILERFSWEKVGENWHKIVNKV